jgi:superfamily II DNA helicase RecQ
LAPPLEGAAPPTPEAYYQETGRAGRDSQLARCVLLLAPGATLRGILSSRGIEGFACT